MYHSEKKDEFPKCPVCGKKFSCESSLACHVRSHRQGKDFECNKCKRTFKYKNNLKVHTCPKNSTETERGKSFRF